MILSRSAVTVTVQVCLLDPVWISERYLMYFATFTLQLNK